MKRIILFVLAVQLLQPLPAQRLLRRDCIESAIISVDTAAGNDAALRFLVPLLQDKRVVLIGESSHGIGDYYAFKSRLVQFLHRELGYNVLAMESGIGDVYLEYKKADTISARQLRNNTVFGNFRCREILPLFDYILQQAKGNKPLVYAGFDSQNFNASFAFLEQLLREEAATAADSILYGLGRYYTIPSMLWQEDKQPLFRVADTIRRAAEAAMAILQQHEASLRQRHALSDTDWLILLRTLRNHRDGVTLDWNRDDPVARRDSLMAQNLFWLMDTLYPGSKFIIWAHNGHIDKGGVTGTTQKWMGHYIRERFGDKSYHIGLFAQEGSTYEWWTRTNKTFNNNKPDDIEHYFTRYPLSFMNLQQASQKQCPLVQRPWFGFELENGGRISFIPARRFDGIFGFRKVSLPDYK